MRLFDRARRGCITAVAVLIAITPARPALAQAYGLYEVGACEMGRGGAGVAEPCDDGSAMYFNPAGLALEKTPVVSAGVTGIAPRGSFVNDTTSLVSALKDRTFPSPHAYVAAPLGTRLVVGAGFFVPYGLTTDWPDTAQGRFVGYVSSIRSYYVQPTVAYRVTDRVMVGGGISITHTSLELRRRVDLATLPITGTSLTFGRLGVPRGTDFADVDLTGSGTDAGAHLGVLVKANDRVSVGARYLARQTVGVGNGRIASQQIATHLVLPVPLPGLPAGTPLDAIVASAFASGAVLSSQTATTDIPLPDQFVAGVAVHPSDRLTLLGDYQYVHWTLFDTVTIANQFAPPTVLVESYRDTHGIRIGAEYALRRAVLRAGFDGHTAAAPDQTVTPILPDAPRREYSFGVGLPFQNARLDLAYLYVDQQDRPGRSTDGGLAVPTTAVNDGSYTFHAHLLAGSIVVRF